MSVLAELLEILVDHVPPKYILPIDEIVDLLRELIDEPLDNDSEEVDEAVVDVLNGLMPYYVLPLEHSRYSLAESWSDELFEVLSGRWNELYDELHVREQPRMRCPPSLRRQ